MSRCLQADLYAVLGVPPTASLADLRAAWLSGVKASHPDLAPEHLRAARTERTQDLNEAWSVLSDEHDRWAYDRERSRPAEPAPPAPGPSPVPPPVETPTSTEPTSTVSPPSSRSDYPPPSSLLVTRRSWGWRSVVLAVVLAYPVGWTVLFLTWLLLKAWFKG